MARLSRGTAVPLLVLVGLGVSCAREESRSAASEPSSASEGAIDTLVVVSIDTLRSDRLPSYGHERVETPAVDRLVRDGVLFERAYSPAPLTLPAHAGLFTGLGPEEHGIRDNVGQRLEAGVETLAERLSEEGWATLGAVSSWVLRAETGIDQGFELWEDSLPKREQATLAEQERSGVATLSALLEALDGREARPRLLFLHLYEPHYPYEAPEPFASRYDDPYDAEIAAADAVLGSLLAELERRGWYESAAIVLLSDHGEGLGDHGELRHGVLLYREVLQVPLVVKLPGRRAAGRRVSVPVDLLDVAPALLDLAGVGAGGSRLLSAIDGEPVAERALLAETFYPRLRFGWSELLSVIEGRWHLVEGPRAELYDVQSDPGEETDLSAARPEVVEALQARLAGIERTVATRGFVDEADRAALEALGYLGGTVVAEEGEALPHPRDRVHVLPWLEQGIGALRDGDETRAIERLEAVLVEAPAVIDAWQFLGLAHERREEWASAREAFERAFELSRGDSPMAVRLGNLALRAGRPDDARRYLEAAVRHDPSDASARLWLTQSLLQLGLDQEALASAREGLRQLPDVADAAYQLAVVEIRVGETGSALGHLRRALDLEPDHLPALSDLASLLTVEGRFAEAAPLFERALALAPQDPGLRANYEQFLARTQADE